jgi:hypothetical protein
MTEQQIQREIDGEWVALEGMIWRNFKNAPRPFGNIHEHEHDLSMPYYLFFDIGSATSAWVLVQRLHDDEWIITAEYTPKRDGSTGTVMRRICEDYGNPCRVVAGADLRTRDSAGGETSEYFVHSVIGGDVPITTIDGWIADKEIQHDSLSRLLCSNTGKRRLYVSKNLHSHDPESDRGVMQLFQQDQWPEESSIRRGEYLPKEGRLEHMRDALLYGAVGVMSPPRYSYTKEIAA